MTGAVVLAAAAELGVVVDAVVCRHARPDFAANALPQVEAPTLLICGGLDSALIEINRAALARLHCEKQLQVVQQTRIAKVTDRDCVGCELAAQWFKSYVRPR
jgi:putative phosphoribosyl transferase